MPVGHWKLFLITCIAEARTNHYKTVSLFVRPCTFTLSATRKCCGLNALYYFLLYVIISLFDGCTYRFTLDRPSGETTMSTLEEHVTLSDEQRSVCQSLETDAPVFLSLEKQKPGNRFCRVFYRAYQKECGCSGSRQDPCYSWRRPDKKLLVFSPKTVWHPLF